MKPIRHLHTVSLGFESCPSNRKSEREVKNESALLAAIVEGLRAFANPLAVTLKHASK